MIWDAADAYKTRISALEVRVSALTDELACERGRVEIARTELANARAYAAELSRAHAEEIVRLGTDHEGLITAMNATTDARLQRHAEEIVRLKADHDDLLGDPTALRMLLDSAEARAR